MMNKKIISGLLVSFLIVFLASCTQIKDFLSIDDAVEILSNDRITIINDENNLSQKLMIVSENITVEEPLFFSASGLSVSRAKKTSFTLTLVAQVNSPEVNGQILQATNIQIKGNLALISYNMKGDTYLGAVDIINIANKKKPKMESRILFNDTDIHSISYSKDAIYLAQAKQSDVGAPAQVESLKFSGNKVYLDQNKVATVSSYAANSVFNSDAALFATSGSAGELYALDSVSLVLLDSLELDHARWVVTNGTTVAVVQGMPGRIALHTFDGVTFSVQRSFSFTGADVAEAKSQAEIINDFIFIAAGTSGVQIHKLSDGSKITEIPLPATDLDPSVVVCNAVTVDDDLLFISNGEAGVYVAQATEKIESISDPAALSLAMLGKLRFNALESVNHVSYSGDYLLIAAGLGGLKVIDVDTK